MIRHELSQILVARRHDHLHAALLGNDCERADDVVGLDAFDHDERPAERAHGDVNRLDLSGEVFRHGGPVGFVFGVPVVAESLAFGIKYARAILCIDFAPQAPQHVDHPIQSAGGPAVGASQVRHRMVGPVQVARTVDQ